ncbi:phage portal protein [uncultured Megasphaera sp.]|uniref:phage portal protein n=1 Tax=uncultured Megasphaera sp. TaxID=165188 RepID=UPI002062B7CE|nr:phage portal protein [uncultured Megasphaera sp.]DAK43015.1 MAG TPA: PORTAL PROTEIN [Caudoviricetes sp.]
MMDFSLNTLWNNIIRRGSNSGLTEIEFLEREIQAWLTSEKRNMMLAGKRYYDGEHDILSKQRQAVDECGNMRTINGLPNNQIVDNRYVELVEQKVNYLLAKPVEVKTEDENYGKKLDKIFNNIFRKRMKNLGIDILNCGIGYLHPYIKEDGTFAIKRFNPEEILPFWKDEEHEIIDSFIRIYPVSVYEGKQKKIIQKADYYTKQGIKHYVYENQNLVPDVEKQEEAYLNINENPFTWSKIPLVAFKYNQREIPLIKRVKCLQDALNILLSNYSDNMMEDIRSTVLILEGYEGEDLATFRKNLLAYGVVKVGTDERKGDVRELRIEVNAANYDLIIKLIKKAIIENGSGFDAKDDRMSNNPNQMNIRSIYSDIDLDANGMELEIQSSLEQLMFFVNTYLNITNNTQNENEVQFIFSRDTPINEAEVIENCRNSIGIISKETIISNHPWTKDTQEEMGRLKKETDEQMEDYVSNTLKEKKDE